MFEELVPAELRDALLRYSQTRADVAHGVAWVDTFGRVPPVLAAYFDEVLERTGRVLVEVPLAYRRGDLTLTEALERLAHEFDLERFEPPKGVRVEYRSSAPPPSER